MSGATIGGVVGAFVGFWIGGPAGAQAGWMIGSAVGGYVDPTQVFGPRLSDVRGQTSSVGGAIPRVWGTAPVPGNIIWQQENPPVTEHRHTDDGKGSGTEQVTYTYTRSYAVMCHIGEIAGFLQVKRNGKVVFDARDDAALTALYLASGMTSAEATKRLSQQRAENAKWLEKCTFYTGTQTQTPDPTIEQYKGAGNVPAYRGRAYFVVTDDETQAGEIAQFEIVVSRCGDVNTEGSGFDKLYLASTDGVISGAITGLNNDASPPVAGNVPLIKILEDKLFYLSGEGHYVRTGAGGVWTQISGLPEGTNNVMDIVHTSAGFIVLVDGDRYVYQSLDGIQPFEPVDCAGPGNTINAVCIMQVGNTLEIDYSDPGVVSRKSTDGGMTWENGTFRTGLADFNPAAASATNGNVVVAVGAYNNYARVRVSTDGMASWVTVATSATGSLNWTYAAHNGARFLILDNDGVTSVSSAGSSGWSSGPSLASAVTGQFKTNRLSTLEDQFVFADAQTAGGTFGAVAFVSNGISAWSNVPSVSIDVVGGTSVTSSPSPLGAIPLPDAPGWYVNAAGQVFGPSYETLTPCSTTTVGEVVAEMCELSGITPDEYDVSQLTDTLDGYVVARETDAASVIESLRPIGMFDPAEWDKKFRGIKRGGTSVAAINADDLVERDGDAFERELVQEVELLRKVSVGYIDTEANWAPNTQLWERRVGTINARGESVIEVPAVFGADQGATVAKRRGLVSWGEPEKQKFSLPYRLAALTGTDVISYTSENGVDYIRLMQIDDDSGVRLMEAATNCAEAYNATATGTAPRPPAITEASLRGPTNLVVMNLPLWRDSDADDVGLYVTADGYLPGWTGSQADISTDGGATYTGSIQITDPGTIGYTTTDLTAWISSENPEDQEVTVYLTDPPSSVTYEVLLTYANRAAMQNDSGDWEILQYQTATALGNDLYTLSGLVRGRFNTTPGVASAGRTFVLLNNTVQFVVLPRDLIGDTLTVRATTYGTSSDAAVPFDVEFDTAVSQTEWPVHNVEATRDTSGDVFVSCIIRDRRGSEVTRFPSVHFAGLRFTYSDGVDTVSYDVSNITIGSSSFGTHEYSLADQIADFGTIPSGGLTVTIAPLNDITGAGPASAGVTI